MKNKNLMTREKLVDIFNFMTNLLLEKNEAYDSSSFELGLQGNFVHIYDKVMRLKYIISNEKYKTNPENLLDTYHDTIGYCCIGLLIHQNEQQEYDPKHGVYKNPHYIADPYIRDNTSDNRYADGRPYTTIECLVPPTKRKIYEKE